MMRKHGIRVLYVNNTVRARSGHSFALLGIVVTDPNSITIPNEENHYKNQPM